MHYALKARTKESSLYLASLNPPRLTSEKRCAILLSDLPGAVKIANELNRSDVARTLLRCRFFAAPLDSV